MTRIMEARYDLIIQEGYVAELEEVVDLGIKDGYIITLQDEIDAESDEYIQAEGNLVSSGLVDAHLHIDKAFAADGERFPKGASQGFSVEQMTVLEDEYYSNLSYSQLVKNIVRDIQMVVSSGSTYLRSHVAVDDDSRANNLEACLEAVERTRNIADIQLVPYSGNMNSLDEALDQAVTTLNKSDVFVGGTDPATRHDNLDATLDAWFELATNYDIGIDLHIQNSGTLGIRTLKRLLHFTKEYSYEGRVTASHSFCLAHIPEWWVDELIPQFREVDMKFCTCYNSTRPKMPVRKLLQEEVVVGHGTDNHRDFVSSHGTGDSIEAALVEANKLHGDRSFDKDYRWFGSNQGLKLLWDMITYEGASVMDVQDEYGIKEETRANIVVFDEPSPQWTINKQGVRSYIIKDGRIIAKNGQLLSDFSLDTLLA